MQLLFERGCLKSPTAKLTKSEAVELLGNMADYERKRTSLHATFAVGAIEL